MNKIALELTRLLVVSRDSAIIRQLWPIGESNGWQLETATDPWVAIDRVQSGEPLSVLVLDLARGSSEGLLSLGQLRRICPELPIILIGYAEDNGRRQEAIRMGAHDYLVRPLTDSQLEAAIQRSLSAAGERYGLDIASEDVEPVSGGGFFVGVSPIMRRLRAQAAWLAEADVPVLIVGEAGSGRETVARLIHQLSVRSGFSFARASCGALPEDLLERELFGGHDGGRSASSPSRAGKLELCANGTIFLDEITEMPSGLQYGLMRVLENRRFTRPGTSDVVQADVRVVAASSKSIERAIAETRLSEKLYHQLGTYTIHVPALRDRKEELSLLARHFMHRIAKRYGLAPRGFSPAITEAWQAYSWPGNLRELEHRVKRYLMVGDEELEVGMHLSVPEGEPKRSKLFEAHSQGWAASSPSQHAEDKADSKSLRSVIQSVRAEAERNAIAVALEKTGWNRKAAARLLDVSYRTVLYKIEQYSLSSSNS